MTSDTSISAQALLTNAVGLHARPAVKLTQLAKKFAAAVDFALEPQGPWTNAKSPVQVMRVKAAKGSMLYFRAHGADAAECGSRAGRPGAAALRRGRGRQRRRPGP